MGPFFNCSSLSMPDTRLADTRRNLGWINNLASACLASGISFQHHESGISTLSFNTKIGPVDGAFAPAAADMIHLLEQ